MEWPAARRGGGTGEDRLGCEMQCKYIEGHDRMVRVCAVTIVEWACAGLGALRPSLSKESLHKPTKVFF